ncbi:hypothetical protein RRF57_010859 [Xylaria bambusicola]|uniref:Uncharacterized protein n=1 Tax=Xylaria bambusicola TaxID=326684 RepID=A0AAN7Z928_9PEZI
MAQACSHQEAVDGVRALLGLITQAYAFREQETTAKESNDETDFEDLGTVKSQDDLEDLFSSNTASQIHLLAAVTKAIINLA